MFGLEDSACVLVLYGKDKGIYLTFWNCYVFSVIIWGARCSSVVRAFAHGAMGRQIDPSWGGPIELFLVLASAPRLV